jgi:hypothetical protein
LQPTIEPKDKNASEITQNCRFVIRDLSGPRAIQSPTHTNSDRHVAVFVLSEEQAGFQYRAAEKLIKLGLMHLNGACPLRESASNCGGIQGAAEDILTSLRPAAFSIAEGQELQREEV